MSTTLSRRSLVTTAAALPAALAVPVVAVAATEPADALARLADQICAEWDRLGTLGRDIEPEDWNLFESLEEQLWTIPSASISDLAVKARVLDKLLRIDGEPHTVSKRQWNLVDDLLALAVQS